MAGDRRDVDEQGERSSHAPGVRGGFFIFSYCMSDELGMPAAFFGAGWTKSLHEG